MFKDGLNVLPLNFLGILCFWTARNSWNKPIFNIRHFEICKLSITLQRLPPLHSSLKVSHVKLLCIVKRSNVIGISWMYIRTKCRDALSRKRRNLLQLSHLLTSSWYFSFCVSPKIVLTPFHKRPLVSKSVSCWRCLPSEHFRDDRQNSIWYIAIIKDRSTRLDQFLSVTQLNGRSRGGGRALPYMGYIGMRGLKGMVFKRFGHN